MVNEPTLLAKTITGHEYILLGRLHELAPSVTKRALNLPGAVRSERAERAVAEGYAEKYGLGPYRRKTFRYQEEQRAIEAWLGLVMEAAPLSADLAIEIAECANLIKGYGDTHKRGSANYRIIVEQVIEPALQDLALKGERPVQQAVDAIASARTAALLDPDGEALAKCLADLAAPPVHAIAAE